MWLFDLLHYFLNAETYVCGYGNDYCWDCVEEFGNCPGTAFTSVAAAFATQGYWVQADLLDMLTFSNLAALGPLIYVASAIGGLIGVAINQPPRIYMWFFLGPAIYGWLIDARQEVNGVQWQVGMRQLDQREVWKLSEVGLLNTNMAKRLEDWSSGHGISASAAPAPVYAANFFVWYDSVLSGVVNGLIDWAGPYAMKDNYAAEVSNVGDGGEYVTEQEVFRNDRWFLLSNLKWSLLQDVTNATVTSASLRDAFATFVGGLCGEELYQVVDEAAFVSAAHGQGNNIPDTIFKRAPGSATTGPNDMTEVARVLNNDARKVSVPDGLTYKGLFKDIDSTGSFYDAIGGVDWPTNSPFSSFAGKMGSPKEDYIRCDQYLMLLIIAFRWEASHIYHQMVLKTPEISSTPSSEFEEQEKKFLYNFFYGWNLKRDRVDADGEVVDRKDPYSGIPLSWDEKRQFLIHLIFLHLVRNEFAIVKQPVDVRRLGADMAVSFAEGQMRTVGSISKFGEVYSWAILMPYLQGVLMYFLAIAYPFACLMMIMPGMHKSLFTWMSFWAWVKIWDVGFALVMALERSVWAMVGNSSKVSGFFDKVVEVGENGSTVIGWCQGATGCRVRDVLLTSGPVGVPGPWAAELNEWVFAQNLRMFDKALALGPSLDLDLSNSYYIYIMAALYLAVPAVTGQLVLGAKAGMASMLTQAIGQNASDAGKGASGSYTEGLSQRASSNFSSIGQAAYGAHLQKTNLASQAMEIGNKQGIAQWRGSEAGAWQQMLDSHSQAKSLQAQQYGQIANFGKSQISAAATLTNAIPTKLTKGAGQAGSPIPAFGLFPQLYGAGADRASGTKSIEAFQAAKEVNSAKAQLGASGFEAQSYAGVYGRAGQLKQAEANYGADMARWKAQNQMANQLGASLAAQGASRILNAGPKPTQSDGMLLSGELGAAAKEQGHLFDPFSSTTPLFGMLGQSTAGLYGAVPQVEARPTGGEITADAMGEAVGVASHYVNGDSFKSGAARDVSDAIQEMTGGRPVLDASGNPMVDSNGNTLIQGGFSLAEQFPSGSGPGGAMTAQEVSNLKETLAKGDPVDVARYNPGTATTSEVHGVVSQGEGKGKGDYHR